MQLETLCEEKMSFAIQLSIRKCHLLKIDFLKDISSNENIKVQDSDGELISRDILDTVVENLDIGEIIAEEIMNDLVRNLELKIEQHHTGGMDIFSRLLGFQFQKNCFIIYYIVKKNFLNKDKFKK